MSEPRWLKAERHKPKFSIPKPAKKDLKCPACGGHTVQRDVSSADGWYVEFCVGGQLRVATKVDGREIFESVSCEYWGSGFGQRN